jgi:O-antigen/teichoic acid export membrane protein
VPAGMLYQATWWLMVVQSTQAAALVACAALRLDLTGAALLFSAAQLAVYVASALYIARKLPRYAPWWKDPSWSIGVRDFWRSTVMVGANFLTQMGTNGLVMLVSSGLGAAAVPAFTTVRTATNLWTTLGNVLTSPLLPEVVRYHAQRDGAKLRTAYDAHLLIATTAVNASILAAFPFLDALYRHWTGGRVALDGSLLCWLLVSLVVGTPGALVTTYLVGINDLRSVTAIFAARGLVPLGVGALLLPTLGISAVGLGVALGELTGPLCLGLLRFRRQLAGLGVVSRSPVAGPTALGAVAVAIFLVAQATRSAYADAAYATAVGAVLVGAGWGWRRVDAEVRDRALRLLRRRPA